MARTFISQPTQVFHSELYSDTLTTGTALSSSATSLQDDLNALRTQVKQVLWAAAAGNWYDVVTAPSGGLSARGLNTINTDLTDLEQKRFLFRTQNLNLVNIATGSNFVFLSKSLGTAPRDFAAVGLGVATGSIVSLLTASEGTYGSHSVTQVSGSSVITPKNLVLVRDAWTHSTITSSLGQEIFGLLQVEASASSGDAFSDTNRKTQISFVQEIISSTTSSLRAVSASEIGGKTIQYSYIRRVALDDLPEDAYLSDQIFIDIFPSSMNFSSSVSFSDITLQTAINNQVGTVSQNKNVAIAIADGFSWAYLSGTQKLWELASSDTTDTLTVNVDRFSVSGTFPASFQKGISVSTGSGQVDLGVIPNTINSLTGTRLVLSGGTSLGFSDGFGVLSNYTGGIIPFATSTLEYNNFTTGFGNQTSLLGALYFLSQSVSASARPRIRTSAGVTTTVVADTNITFPTNLDAALSSYSGKNFQREINVFLNGVLLIPGFTVGNPNDVYPGTSPSTGDLKFPMTLRSGTLLSIEVF